LLDYYDYVWDIVVSFIADVEDAYQSHSNEGQLDLSWYYSPIF